MVPQEFSLTVFIHRTVRQMTWEIVPTDRFQIGYFGLSAVAIATIERQGLPIQMRPH